MAKKTSSSNIPHAILRYIIYYIFVSFCLWSHKFGLIYSKLSLVFVSGGSPISTSLWPVPVNFTGFNSVPGGVTLDGFTSMWIKPQSRKSFRKLKHWNLLDIRVLVLYIYIFIYLYIYIFIYLYIYLYIYILGIHHWNTLEYPIEVIILGKSFHWNTLEYTTELATESTSPKVVEVGLAMACVKHACRDEWGRCARQGIPTVVASTIWMGKCWLSIGFWGFPLNFQTNP